MPATSGGKQRKDRAEHETVRSPGEGGGKIGAEHVERAVRQIDQIHDAEDQRQAGREQKQQHAELHAVKALLDEIEHGIVEAPGVIPGRCARTSNGGGRPARPPTM